MTDYGIDFQTTWNGDGTADMDPFFVEVTGVEAVIHATLRRFLFGKGRLPWAPQAGMDLRGLIATGLTTAQVAALASQIQDEAEKDERVYSALATVTANGDELRIQLQIETGEGPFTLVFAASEDAIERLQ